LIRLAVIFVIAVAAWVALRILLAHKPLSIRQFVFVYLALLAGLLLVWLGVSGRVPWLFGLLGAALPFIARGFLMVLRFVGLQALMKRFRQSGFNPNAGTHTSAGQKSELNTRLFAMVLDHDSGQMDGRVLEGPQAGRTLSELDLSSLLDLYEFSRQDPDSCNVLAAFLDRRHPGWQERAGASTQSTFDDGNMSVRQAYEILGLEQDAARDAVIEAHRRLMQKVHPDRGGSTYLAARINEAKTVLLKQLGD